MGFVLNTYMFNVMLNVFSLFSLFINKSIYNNDSPVLSGTVIVRPPVSQNHTNNYLTLNIMVTLLLIVFFLTCKWKCHKVKERTQKKLIHTKSYSSLIMYSWMYLRHNKTKCYTAVIVKSITNTPSFVLHLNLVTMADCFLPFNAASTFYLFIWLSRVPIGHAVHCVHYGSLW